MFVMLHSGRYETDTSALGQQAPEGLPLIFGRSGTPRFVTSITTAVTYHSKTPTFAEEFKVTLPMPLTERHHAFFAFAHVAVDDNSKKSTIETPIGYAWLPLARTDTALLDDQTFELMVAQVRLRMW